MSIPQIYFSAESEGEDSQMLQEDLCAQQDEHQAAREFRLRAPAAAEDVPDL